MGDDDPMHFDLCRRCLQRPETFKYVSRLIAIPEYRAKVRELFPFSPNYKRWNYGIYPYIFQISKLLTIVWFRLTTISILVAGIGQRPEVVSWWQMFHVTTRQWSWTVSLPRTRGKGQGLLEHLRRKWASTMGKAAGLIIKIKIKIKSTSKQRRRKRRKSSRIFKGKWQTLPTETVWIIRGTPPTLWANVNTGLGWNIID